MSVVTMYPFVIPYGPFLTTALSSGGGRKDKKRNRETEKKE